MLIQLALLQMTNEKIQMETGKFLFFLRRTGGKHGTGRNACPTTEVHMKIALSMASPSPWGNGLDRYRSSPDGGRRRPKAKCVRAFLFNVARSWQYFSARVGERTKREVRAGLKEGLKRELEFVCLRCHSVLVLCD